MTPPTPRETEWMKQQGLTDEEAKTGPTEEQKAVLDTIDWDCIFPIATKDAEPWVPANDFEREAYDAELLRLYNPISPHIMEHATFYLHNKLKNGQGNVAFTEVIATLHGRNQVFFRIAKTLDTFKNEQQFIYWICHILHNKIHLTAERMNDDKPYDYSSVVMLEKISVCCYYRDGSEEKQKNPDWVMDGKWFFNDVALRHANEAADDFLKQAEAQPELLEKCCKKMGGRETLKEKTLCAILLRENFYHTKDTNLLDPPYSGPERMTHQDLAQVDRWFYEKRKNNNPNFKHHIDVDYMSESQDPTGFRLLRTD